MAIFTNIAESISRAIDFAQPIKTFKTKFSNMFKNISAYMSKPFKIHEKSLGESITNMISKTTRRAKKETEKPLFEIEALGVAFKSIGLRNIIPTVKNLGKAIKGTVGKKAVAGMKKMGKGIKSIFQSMGGAMGIFGMIMQVLDSLGILKPFMTMINAIVKIIGGKVVGSLMPLIMKFIDVLMSPEFMALFDAIANMLISILTPIMEVILNVMTAIAPMLPMIGEIMMILGEVIGELIMTLFDTPEFMTMMIGLMWALYGVIQAIIFVVRIFIIVFTFIRNVIIVVIQVIIWIINVFSILHKGIMFLINPILFLINLFIEIGRIIGSIFGGGKKGKKQYGGMIPRTGLYQMEVGERVDTEGDVTGQHNETVELMEEMIDVQKQTLHYMRYERDEE